MLQIKEEIQEFVQTEVLVPVKTRTDRVRRFFLLVVFCVGVLSEVLYVSGQWCWLLLGPLIISLVTWVMERRFIRPGYRQETEIHCENLQKLKLK